MALAPSRVDLPGDLAMSYLTRPFSPSRILNAVAAAWAGPADVRRPHGSMASPHVGGLLLDGSASGWTWPRTGRWGSNT